MSFLCRKKSLLPAFESAEMRTLAESLSRYRLGLGVFYTQWVNSVMFKLLYLFQVLYTCCICRDIIRGSPDVKWESIKGLENAKRLLKEAVVMPIKYPK